MADPKTLNRREFMAKAGAAALSATVLPADLVRGPQANSKIRLGLVGCGGRGVWIAKLFQKHGGYEIAITTLHSRPIPGTPSSGSRPGASTGPFRAT